MQKHLLSATVLASAFLLAACGANSTPTSGSAQPNNKSGGVTLPVPIPTSIASSSMGETPDLSMPLDAYQPTPLQQADIAAAFDVLLHRCMAHSGFDYPSSTLMDPSTHLASEQSIPMHRYGYSTPSDVQKFLDYMRVHPMSQNGGQQPDQTVPTMSQAEAAALHGTSDSPPGQAPSQGGCMAQAVTQMKAGGAAYGDSSLYNSIDAGSFNTSLQAKPVKDAFAEWSSCMKTSGYTYADPIALQRDASLDESAEHFQTVATASVKCSEQVDLLSIWHGVDVKIESEAIDKHAQELDALKKANDLAIKHAADVLAGGA